MKLTGQMVHEASNKATGASQPWHTLSTKTLKSYNDCANILYAQLFADELTYNLDYAEDEDNLFAADLEDLLRLIKEHGVEGDSILIYVQDEDFVDIGSGQFYYMQDGKFLQVVESDGAAIDLEKTLNEMEAKQTQPSA